MLVNNVLKKKHDNEKIDLIRKDFAAIYFR